MRKFEDLIKLVANICKKCKINYVIVGGVAVSAWGNIRTTRDIDIIFDLKNGIRKFLEELKKNNLILREEDLKKALKEKSHFTVFDAESEFYIDGKGSYSPNDSETLSHKKAVRLDRVKIFINSPENLIANKLLFGSEQDLKDAESVYIRQLGRLDFEYLEKRCKELNVHKKYSKMKNKLDFLRKE